MSTSFDPYRVWLGIPVEEQPANHYRLLGIGLFESDPMVISNAADRQMAHVRTFQNGKHAAISQKILNELAAVRVTLLDSQRKAQYDAQLRTTLPQGRPVQPVTSAIPVSVPVFETSSRNPLPKRSKAKKQSPEWVVGGVLAAMGLLLVLYLSFPAPKKAKTVPKAPKKAEIAKEEKNDTSVLPTSLPVAKKERKREKEREIPPIMEEETASLAVVPMENAGVRVEELFASPDEKKNFEVAIYHSNEKKWKKGNLEAAKKRIQDELLAAKTRTSVLDFAESREGRGHFPNNFQLPGGRKDYYTLVAKVDVVFTEETAGLWTFGFITDDGGEMTVWDDTGEVLMQIRFSSRRLMKWETSKDYNVAAFKPGRYHIEVIQYDNLGDSGVELYAAPGVLSAFSPQFRLIGDVGNGGLPTEPFTEPWKK
ncbi:MAG: hypothetical protein Q4D62_13400 [Planctomycetia bacterium]|nr:hypothetical protein [Planctomycetia bacterium]